MHDLLAPCGYFEFRKASGYTNMSASWNSKSKEDGNTAGNSFNYPNKLLHSKTIRNHAKYILKK
jgi:hypothetical protein